MDEDEDDDDDDDDELAEEDESGRSGMRADCSMFALVFVFCTLIVTPALLLLWARLLLSSRRPRELGAILRVQSAASGGKVSSTSAEGGALCTGGDKKGKHPCSVH